MPTIPTHLTRIFQKISLSEGAPTFDDGVFDFIARFLKEYEDQDYPQLIYDHAPTADPRHIAALFDLLIWSTRDNGGRLIRTYQTWLDEPDERKVEIVLRTTAVLPYKDTGRLERQLEVIEERFPGLRGLCEGWRERI